MFQRFSPDARRGVPPPSIVVHSGHGVHLYWILSEPVIIDDALDPPPVFAEFVDQGEGKKKRRRLWIAGEKPGERLYIDVPTHEPRLSPKRSLWKIPLSESRPSLVETRRPTCAESFVFQAP